MTIETDDTRGLSQRELLLEMRGDLKKLTEANLVERVEKVEGNQTWAGRAIILQFIALIGGAALLMISVKP